MATKTTCDICGNDAQHTVEYKVSQSPIKKDLCGPHHAQWKKLTQAFFGQEPEVELGSSEVKKGEVVTKS